MPRTHDAIAKAGRWQARARGLAGGMLAVCLGLSTTLAGTDAPLNPDDPAYLRRQYAWFQSLEPGRQAQLRKLHADFQALEPAERQRHESILKTYNAWLAELPSADRQRVLDAANGAERIEVVRQIREEEWVRTLPVPYRQEYALLQGEARRLRVLEWRAEEASREEEWSVAVRSWEQFTPGKIPAVFQNESRQQIELLVGRLRENLTESEQKSLDESRAAAEEFGNYLGYAYLVVSLLDAHPILPGRVGPRDFSSLPDPVREYLLKSDRNFKRKGSLLAGEELKDVRRSQGRWPDFAVELTRYCQKNKLALPVPLGDCRKEEMPAEVVVFLDKTLEPLLRRSEAGRADLEALNRAQGSWPEYPRMILDLARKYKLHLPGWTLPGPPGYWERLRSSKSRPR